MQGVCLSPFSLFDCAKGHAGLVQVYYARHIGSVRLTIAAIFFHVLEKFRGVYYNVNRLQNIKIL